MKHQMKNNVEQENAINYKGEPIIVEEEKIKFILDEKADNVPMWDNTVKDELQIQSSELKDNNEIVISSNFSKIKKIEGFDDERTLLYIPAVFIGTEVFSINKTGEIKSYLRTGKYLFMNGPYKIDNSHYIWEVFNSEVGDMTTLVCTDKDFNFLWDYSYDTRVGSYHKPVYTIKDEGFITLEEDNIIKFFNKDSKLIWQYELPKETFEKILFALIEDNIEIFIRDMKLTLNFSGELIDEKVFPYLFLQVEKSEKFTYYRILDNVKRQKTGDGLSYKLICNDSQNYLLREDNKSKEKTKIDYVIPDNYGEIILVDDYCFYQSHLGGWRCELAIISEDKNSSISMPSHLAIKPIINDENIELFVEEYIDDGDITKGKKILLNKNGDVVSEKESELNVRDYQYICEVFEIDDTLYKIEEKEIFDPKRKSDVMFWQFIISPY